MQPVSPNASRYDTVTIVYHWLTFALVVEQWLLAQIIDWFPRGAPRIDARSVHIILGLVLAALLVGRIVWRLTGGRHLPPADRGLAGVAAKAVHWCLYGLIAAMLLAGFILTWVRGDSLFNLVTIPAFDPGNRGLIHRAQAIHATIGWFIVGFAGLHVAAALMHRLIWRDGVLGRMWPGRG